MRTLLLLVALPSLATAAPVHLVQQGRLLDATGVPIQGDHSVVVTLCPNLAPTPGEACRDETFPTLAFDDGYFSLVLGSQQTLDHSVFDAPDLSVTFTVDGSTLGDRQRVAQLVPRTGGMLYLGSATDSDCADDTNESAIIYRNGLVQVCTGDGWKSLAFGETLVQVNGVRRWSDGSYAPSCEGYIRPSSEGQLYVGATGDGVYRIDPDGPSAGAPFDVWCDMTSDGGGFTLVMNLDTSDGHAMWWGNSLWTSGATHGSVDSNPFDGDIVSPAYTALDGTTDIRIVVHEQGTPRGSKRWSKPNGAAVAAYIAGGDNTVLGASVVASDVSGLSSSEFLVRTTTTLYANHCVNGTCVTDTGGSPDGHRIGSDQAAPSNNNGGGIGNWSDINYCCHTSNFAGHACNGSAIRTASEAQGGWASTHGGGNNTGTFGTDSRFPMNNTGRDTSCSQAHWAAPNGIDYDYAIYVR